METYTQTLERKLKIAQKICDGVNIPYRTVTSIKVNTRAKSRWGLCRHLGCGNFEIEISERLLQPDVPDMSLMNTLLHELLHTCKDCMNHGSLWKTYAQRLNDIGFDIKRCSSAEEKQIPDIRKESYKYEVVCATCGYTYKYMRKSKVITMIENNPTRHGCRCGNCKSRNLKLRTL